MRSRRSGLLNRLLRWSESAWVDVDVEPDVVVVGFDCCCCWLLDEEDVVVLVVLDE